MYETKDTGKYEELEVIKLPSDVPEIGVKAGHPATIVDVLSDGVLTVDVSDGEGRTLDLLDVETSPQLKVIGRWNLSSSSA
jgi:hypothetical protein